MQVAACEFTSFFSKYTYYNMSRYHMKRKIDTHMGIQKNINNILNTTYYYGVTAEAFQGSNSFV